MSRSVRSFGRKWWVFAVIASGTFISVADNGAVLVALPEIEEHFASDLPTVQWVVVAYALAISALILPMGRLGDLAGRKQVYIAGLLLFAIGSGLAGFAVNLPWLIAAKVLQGVGSAMVQGNGMATIIAAFPNSERGKALGTHQSVVGSGVMVGPALGGLLVAAFGWRSVLFFNVPVAVITIIAAWYILNPARDGDRDALGGFDGLGTLLSAATLLAFLLVVGNGDRLGWTAPLTLGGAAGTAALAALFVWWELRCPSPMLDLRLFRRKLVALGIAASWMSFLGTQSTRFMMPFYLQRVLELSPRDVGLLMIPPAVCMVLLGPVSGQLSDKFGWRLLTALGLTLSAAGCFTLAGNLTAASPVVFIVAMLMLQYSGVALFNSPNHSSVLSAVDRSQYGVTSALTQLVRNSANITSIAIATTVVVATMGARGVEPSLDAVSPAVAGAFVDGLKWAFWLMGGLLVVGIILSIARGERQRQQPPPPRPAPSAPATQPDNPAQRPGPAD